VGADRYQAGLLAEKKFPSKLHLLDDGFQHRRLHRDFDIVMLRPEDLKDTLLPVGRLRESLAALRRADAVVLEPEVPAPAEAARVWRVRRELMIDSSSPRPITRVVAFCGIARPEQFFAALKSAKLELAETIVFRDHHRYEQSDIGRLLQVKARTGADGFVTTEKDIVKLQPFSAAMQPLNTAVLKLQFESSPQVVEELLRTIEQPQNPLRPRGF
jgi:tetraacyldisaccharide 4'-kinase